MAVVTTLDFNGRTEEALEHYCHALGAEILFLMRFRDSPQQSRTKPDLEDLIFHATFRIEDTVIMATDVGASDSSSRPVFAGFSLAIQLQSLQRGRKLFDALSEGGKIVIPLDKSAFTSWYGIVVDRFGVSWKINVDSDNE